MSEEDEVTFTDAKRGSVCYPSSKRRNAIQLHCPTNLHAPSLGFPCRYDRYMDTIINDASVSITASLS
ncbi:hypothetical protein N9260_02100 [bacterium]|nr:hypothetical protein [bacterium]